jgi:pimeloyl-ACP methyl ester carboxylesterase
MGPPGPTPVELASDGAERGHVSPVRRRYVDVGDRQVHIATAGPDGGRPVVLLHQTPRSVDEFAEVLAALGATRRAIAVDLPGMGASDPAPEGPGIAAMAASVVAALDALGVVEFDLVGHHTGGVVAVEIAARAADRVRRLVLSSTPLVDAASRRRRRTRPPIDAVDVDESGAFLLDLWNGRKPFYPPGRADLLVRFVRDALRVGDPEAGHRAVGEYVMERRIGDVRAATLVVTHVDDPFAAPEQPLLTDALRAAGLPVVTAEIAGGTVPLEHTASAFVAAVSRFLDDDPRRWET